MGHPVYILFCFSCVTGRTTSDEFQIFNKRTEVYRISFASRAKGFNQWSLLELVHFANSCLFRKRPSKPRRGQLSGILSSLFSQYICTTFRVSAGGQTTTRQPPLRAGSKVRWLMVCVIIAFRSPPKSPIFYCQFY